MKKLFLSLMLVAGLAAGFTSCKKNDDGNNTTTHTQTFTLGDETYDINNAIIVENIQYDDVVYNVLMFVEGDVVGATGGDAKGVIILFKGDIKAGSYVLSDAEYSFPKYFYAEIEADDIVNFDINDLAEDGDAYMAYTGIFDLSISGEEFTATSTDVEVVKASDEAIIATSSVDYKGTPLHYELAEVEEGSLSDGEAEYGIATAGCITYKILILEQNIACFIAETGDMIGFTYNGTSVPTGDLTDSMIIWVEEMDIEDLVLATSGSIHVEKEGNIYTVDITDATINGKVYDMHYVGTLPYFEFPF